MTELAVDYSFARPAPDALKRAGVAGVIRYTTGSKAITRDEAAALRALGLWIALVHETDAARVNVGGTAGGAEDAQQAKTFGDELGYPTDAVDFYACDTSPNQPAAFAYFRGVRSVPTLRPVGWYGGMQVGLALKAAGLVDVVWVANAASWSGYPHFDALAPVARATHGVSMLQRLDHPLAGIDPGAYDIDEVIVPFPAWGRTSAPAPKPTPIPPPVVRLKGVPVDTITTIDVVVPTTAADKPGAGDGWIDVPGVIPYARVVSVTIVGLHDPAEAPAGYVPIPRVALDAHATARVIIEGGVPGGRYVVRIAHA